MQQRLFILSQYLLPHHLLSRLIGCAAECRAYWFKSRLINWFAKQYQVDMSEAAVEQLDSYEHFNAFFTRALKDGARLAKEDFDISFEDACDLFDKEPELLKKAVEVFNDSVTNLARGISGNVEAGE